MKMLVEALLQSKITAQGLDLLNASAHVTKDFPPAFVMTCVGDFQFKQAPFMTKALEEAGVQYEYHCYGSEEQVLWHVFHLEPNLEVCLPRRACAPRRRRCPSANAARRRRWSLRMLCGSRLRSRPRV